MSAIYESEKILAEYLLFHYATTEEILPSADAYPQGMRDALDFPVRTAAHFALDPVDRGLDLGCAVGRSAFEMSRACNYVIGIDYSHAFIHAAETLGNGGTIPYDRLEEAALVTPLVAQLPNGINPSRVRFMQGDAMDLPESLSNFDRVHAANLLCRLSEPARLLGRLPDLVKPGGELVLATPCTWLDDFTPSRNWPVGSTFEWIFTNLSPAFSLVRQTDEPFLIRETARKFQWTKSLVTVWRRRV